MLARTLTVAALIVLSAVAAQAQDTNPITPEHADRIRALFDRGDPSQPPVDQSEPDATARAAAHGARGVQLTPDHDEILVNADIGGERWAITVNVDTSIVSGNVFFQSVQAPAFLWCPIVDTIDRGAVIDGSFVLECWGAASCPLNGGRGGTCHVSQWEPLGTIEMPVRFMVP